MEDSGSAVDQTVGQIRHLIRERSLTIGDVLPAEAELSVMFGIGRNTVREAVRTLKAYGVVESRQKVGAVIKDGRQAAVASLFSFAMEINAETFKDIQGFRRLTEMNLFDRLSVNLTEERFLELQELNRLMALAADPVQASECDYLFHKRLVDFAANETLSEIYGMLKPVIRRLMEAGKSQRLALNAAADEHASILAALRARSSIDFVYHMNRHLDAGLEFISNRSGQEKGLDGRASVKRADRDQEDAD